MKTVLFICLCLSSVAFTQNINGTLATLVDQLLELFTRHKTECIAQSGAEVSDIMDAFKTLKLSDKEPFKCYFKCAFEKLNYLDADGNFDLSMALTIPGVKDKALVEECTNSVANEKNLCEKVYKLLLCGVPKILASFG
ncbi:hypothetical protein FQA39_LY18332 [Lamprigera yunnana]|nr:hypothetical protein FQA39_LY18332 [Lamprigera yunnana]